MKSDQERVSKLLTDTVTLLCKNGLVYSQEIKVQGLLGITLDKNEVFLVHINELIGGHVGMAGSEKSPALGSSESSTRKKAAAASASSKVVDLTRVADTPRPPVQPVVNQQLPTGQVAVGRKHRPGKQALPVTMVVPPQQVPARMHHGSPHPRMGIAPPHQSPMANRFASNYLAQLRQQVARGMSPVGRVMPPARQRPVKLRVPTCTTDDDDEDVVIVGTGHEEPSPGWSSPMRKRPLPSHMSSSPAPPQKRPSFQTPPKLPVVQAPPPTVIEEHLGGADIAGTLELTADDIPTSIEDMIMKISSPTHKTLSSKPAMPPEVRTVTIATVDQVEASLLPAEDCAIMTEPSEPQPGALISAVEATATNDATEPVTAAVENTGQAVAVAAQHPFVYTDIACDAVSSCLET